MCVCVCVSADGGGFLVGVVVVSLLCRLLVALSQHSDSPPFFPKSPVLYWRGTPLRVLDCCGRD